MEPGDWKCSCGTNNFKKRHYCFNCDKRKPFEDNSNKRFKAGDKICPKCKELNFASRTICRKCSSNLPQSTSPTKHEEKKIVKREGDWECPNDKCREINFKSRDVCRRCFTVKFTMQDFFDKSKNLKKTTNTTSTPNQSHDPSNSDVSSDSDSKSGDSDIDSSSSSSPDINPVRSRETFRLSPIHIVPKEKAISSSSSNSSSSSSSNSNSSTSSDPLTERVCSVCIVEPKMFAIKTCGHFCFCSVCGYGLNKCPICGNKYNPDTDLLKIYDS